MRMRSLFLLVLCLIMSQQALSQVAFEVFVDASNKYIWRGFKLSDSAVIQPGLRAEFGGSGISLMVWNNTAVQDRHMYKTNDELDFTLKYDKEFNNSQFRINGGVIEYTFPGSSSTLKHSEEIFFGIGKNWMIAKNTNLNPNLTVYYDFRRFEAFYSEIGITPNFTLNGAGTFYVELDISAGLSNYDVDSGNGGDGLKFNNFSAQLLLSNEFSHSTQWIQIGYNLSNSNINPDKSDFLMGIGISIRTY